jgi:DNA polymerase-3 subunit gamma/tau
MYAPSEEDRYKVYIIDEAHMLTREAWNALLKILEEPPPRVIFVFATTEAQKIQQAAPPILSRCQRFDFHRISTPDLVGRLRTVLRAEGMEAGDDVLLPIAQKADGGMRDGLSLLDQVLSFTEGTPTADDVRRVLGLVGHEVFLELFDVIAERRAADVFRFVGTLLDRGYDLAEFYRALADYIRILLMVRLGGGEPDSVREDLRAAVLAQASRFSPGDLLRMLSQVAELDADGRFRKSGEQRILIEVLLLRFAYLESTVTLEDVLAAVAGTPPGESRGNGSGGRSAAPDAPAARLAGPPATPPSPGTFSPSSIPPARPLTASSTGSQATMSRPPAPPAPSPAAPVQVPVEAKRSEHPVVADPEPETAPPPEEPQSSLAEPEPIAGVPEAMDDAAPLDPARVRRGWMSMLQEGDGVPPGMSFMLRGARLDVAGGTVHVAVPEVAMERLDSPAARKAMEQALGKRLHRGVRIAFASAGTPAAADPGTGRITADGARQQRLRRLTEGEPLLQAAVSEWDLELVE